MKIFLIWAARDIEILIKGLEKEGHEILYWVGSKGDENIIPGAIFQDHYDAWKGIPPASVDINEFNAPSKELIQKMHGVESLVLTMMDKAFDQYCVNHRKNIYYQMLGYWNGIIDKYKPELILFPIVPHTVYNHIIYELAKLKGIKTLMFEDTWVSDRLIMYEDWQKGSEKLQKNIKENENRNFTLDDLSLDLKEYYLSQTNLQNDATPIYMQHYKKQFSSWNVFLGKIKKISSFVDINLPKRLIKYLHRQFQDNLKKEYKKLQTDNFNLDLPFIYVPLQFQPERTTSPQGDIYVDQILMVETISRALPKNWKIYIKEHPSQWWLRSGVQYSSVRYQGYYQKLISIKNVCLLPVSTNSFDLIEKSMAVATPTGTAGWEAILRSKPALIFGYPWYRDFSEIFRINNMEDCQQALEKIKNGFKIDQQKVINFLKNLDEATMHGYVESFVNKISKVSANENIKNITDQILNHIKKI